ncbi:DUF1648 domain-containing protein [Actinopolyspora erythraea]|uniref:DUF1648 domain-containing protein n=1 Tax=Actinopolyspora erythraea TaxID=414996 RepID=A0A223RM70_9ACTN|nr:DUF1648 domain-containing protein [Actinopolyspora erythraea]ASU76992.1 DUF1648 domain-containing protein [Actinopolyspora erythraea]
METDPRPRFPWLWLAPSAVLLAVMTAWGAAAYPDLPEVVPSHIGPGGVNARSPRTVGSAFVPVFLYIATTVLLTTAAFVTVRTVPESELPSGRGPDVFKRTATWASAARYAKAILVFNAALGVALLPLCAVQWRTTRAAEVPWWPFPLLLVLIVVGLVPLFVAARRDRAEKRLRASSDGGR